MITTERRQELLDLYDEMKVDIGNIEKKYSLSYYKVEMDFPESLGIPLREYIAPTDEELVGRAAAQVDAKFLEKRRNLEKSHATTVANLQKSLELLAEKHRQILVDNANEYAEDLQKLLQKLTNNGLYRSSLRTDQEKLLQENRQAAVDEQNLRYGAEKTATENIISAADKRLSDGLQSVEEQRLAAVTAEVEKLKDSEASKKKEVEKYNASVAEKEAKYKASCERYLQYAQQAENERALSAARLYAELGESGVELQKKSQMLNYCKTAMWSLTKEEAQFILSLDSFLSANLGDYYSPLVDWVNTQLS